MGLALKRFHETQQRLYNAMTPLTAYTVTELVALAHEFSADSDIKTPGVWDQKFDEIYMDFIDGLARYGYIEPDIAYGGDALNLDDWIFGIPETATIQDAPAPEPSWAIPWTIQGTLVVGVAP